MPRVKADPARVLRRVKRELRLWIRDLKANGYPKDPRAVGQLEALQLALTNIEIAERLP